MKVRVKRVRDDAHLPEYATEGAACFDLKASSDTLVRSGGSAVVRTGLAFEIPQDTVMLLFSRSGLGFKYGIRLANSVGVIDADYRGEVMVKLHNDGERAIRVEAGDRIAQAMILPVTQATFEEAYELSETTRGSGGFGSTGK